MCTLTHHPHAGVWHPTESRISPTHPMSTANKRLTLSLATPSLPKPLLLLRYNRCNICHSTFLYLSVAKQGLNLFLLVDGRH